MDVRYALRKDLEHSEATRWPSQSTIACGIFGIGPGGVRKDIADFYSKEKERVGYRLHRWWWQRVGCFICRHSAWRRMHWKSGVEEYGDEEPDFCAGPLGEETRGSA